MRIFAVWRPNNRSTHCHNRAIGLCLGALALLLGATIGHSQWVEKTITLPDSLGGMSLVQGVTVNYVQGKIYVGGDSFITVLDATTLSKLRRIPTGSEISDMCYNPISNKVYSAHPNENTVSIIDCATDSIVATPSILGEPRRLCFNPTSNKVYNTSNIGVSLTVIDGVSDRVVKTLYLGHTLGEMCHYPANNRLFVGDLVNGHLFVVDCAADTVVADVATDGADAVSINTVSGKVYCGEYNRFYAVDAASNAVLRQLAVHSDVKDICCDSVTNMVYCLSFTGLRSYIDAADGAVDTLVGTGQFNSQSFAVVAGGSAHRVYCSMYDSDDAESAVLVFDSLLRNQVWAARVPDFPLTLVHCPEQNALYCAGYYGQGLSEIPTNGDTVARTTQLGEAPWFMCYNGHDDKVYYAHIGNIGYVGVIDGRSRTLRTRIRVGRKPNSLTYAEEVNKVYCANAGGDISVIDGTTDSLLETIGTTMSTPKYYAAGRKLYGGVRRGDVGVIDVEADSLVRIIDVPNLKGLELAEPRGKLYSAWELPGANCGLLSIDCATDSVTDTVFETHGQVVWELCYDSVANKLYCSLDRPPTLLVVDVATDSVVAQVSRPSPSGEWCGLLYAATKARKVYWLRSDSILAVDDDVDTVVAAWRNPDSEVTSVISDHTGTFLYCAFHTRDLIGVLDTRLDSVVRRIPVGAGPYQAVLDEAQRTVYVSDAGSSGISIIRDSMTGLTEPKERTTLVASWAPLPTIVRADKPLAGYSCKAVIFDALGRELAAPEAVRAAGVYFYVANGCLARRVVALR